MGDVDDRLAELIARYDRPDACAAALLCDDHSGDDHSGDDHSGDDHSGDDHSGDDHSGDDHSGDDHPGDAVAFTVVEEDLTARDLTYRELRAESTRFAAALSGLGIGPGDAVGVLMGKSVELVVVLLGIWRRGAVHVPLFTAFAPAAIELRLRASGARLVVVDTDQRPKLDPGADMPAAPPWRVVVATGQPRTGEHSLDALLAPHRADDPDGAPVVLGGGAPLVYLFTSGTTGAPKAVSVPVRALASFVAYLDWGLDVTAGDVYWNAADPGWAYGLYYAILGPLAAGRRSLLLHAGFSPALTWGLLERFGVTNLAAAPTVYRALRADPVPVPSGLALRRLSSAGEPLTPDVVTWSQETFGVAVRDHYGQTEHGMVIANGWAEAVRGEIRHGSMGRPLPGWTTAVLAEDTDEQALPGVPGRIAIDTTASPLRWFTGYADDPERTAQRHTADGRWYLTGDAGSVGAEGYYTFSARDDDVIIMAGYRIGPFEVESVLVMHPDVVEAAVVGVPDALRGEVLEAFVVVRPGTRVGPALAADLKELVKTRFAAHAYPREVHVVAELPTTPSGKVQRYLLRQRLVRG